MFVIGYPKSGNTWFCYLLAYCLNVPYENLMEPGVHPKGEYHRKLVKGGLPHKSFVVKVKEVLFSHEFSTLKNYLNKDFTLYLIRDGRDIIVSYYYYLNKFLVMERNRTKGKGILADLFNYLGDFIEPYRFTTFVKHRFSQAVKTS